MSAVCSVTGWSAVASAATNSTLAGVLAGFMINGIILVLGNISDKMRDGYVQGLSLLFAAFVALGVDAFLFSVATGENTQVLQDNVGVCRRAWTEAMFGAGLLAVGTTAIIAGFIFLFTAYLSKPQGVSRESINMLKTLCNGVRAGLAIAIVTALFMTSKTYLNAVYNGSVPLWGDALIWEFIVNGLFVLAFSFAAIFDNQFSERVRASDDRQLRKALKWGLFWSVIYTIISAVATAMVAVSRASFWYPIYQDKRWIVYAVVTWVSLVPLVPLSFLLGRAVPKFVLPGTQGASSEGELADGSGSQDPPRDTSTTIIIAYRIPGGNKTDDQKQELRDAISKIVDSEIDQWTDGRTQGLSQ
jgi:hypothetical protein